MSEPGTPKQWREAFRSGLFRTTAGLAPGHAQANLIVMAKEYALDFAAFCQRNPKPCPVLEMGTPGDPRTRVIADGADVREDVPLYRVYWDGVLADEPRNIVGFWSKDLVYFLLGCSFGFEEALRSHGVPVRHIDRGTNCAMYLSNLECVPSGPFRGRTVVSMRGIPAGLVSRAVALTARHPLSHGAPLWVGDPAGLGIKDLAKPDFGDPPELLPGDVPVFWACGVTAHVVAANARLPLAIGHAPGHMFIADVTNEELALRGL
jgi:uncharacterized protein YcsI (UPF0317 family)